MVKKYFLFLPVFVWMLQPVFAQKESATVQALFTDLYTDQPLWGIRLDAGGQHTWSDDWGQCNLSLSPGTYDIMISSYGYEDLFFEGVQLDEGQLFTIDTALDLKALPPTNVFAQGLDYGYSAQVSWEFPGCFVLSRVVRDDGEADDFCLWQNPGSQNAVRFNAYTYPFVITGGDVYVGDSTFPGPFLGSSFDMLVYDDDGEGGMPGTLLGRTTVAVENYGWVHFDDMNVAIYSGDVYLSMMQTAAAQESAPLGVDMDNPTYNWGFSKFGDSAWMVAPYQDFMIRPWIAYPHPVVHMDHFRVCRLSDFDPFADTLSGYTITELASTQNLSYDDFSVLGWGLVAYCVRTYYSNGMFSDCQPSNVAWIKRVQMDVNVTFSSGLPGQQADVYFEGLTGQEDLYGSTGTGTAVSFTDALIGKYNLKVSKPGCKDYLLQGLEILSDTSFDVVLEEDLIPPRNLTVTYLIDSILVEWAVPVLEVDTKAVNDSIPGNLLGYHVYRDGDTLATILDPMDTVYTDKTFDYCTEVEYTVTAIYDVSFLGNPGETMDSDTPGTVSVITSPVLQLDYYEGWDDILAINCWTHDYRWVVDESMGDPSPSIAFHPENLAGNYSSILMGPQFDDINTGLGKVVFSYDVELKKITTEEGDQLVVQLQTDLFPAWTDLQIISGGSLNTGWVHYEHDISSLWNQYFTFRFVASGTDPGSIEGWYLDNVRVERKCSPPSGLTSLKENESNIHISWEPPAETISPSAYIIYRDKDETGYEEVGTSTDLYYDDAGLSNGKYCYHVAAYYENELGNCTALLEEESCQIISLGIKENREINNVSVSPNPFHDRLKIVVPEMPSQEKLCLSILSIMGHELKRYEDILGKQTIDLDLSDLPKGAYFLRITMDNELKTFKVIKL